MSVTFSVSSESIEQLEGKAVRHIRTLYPEGFDNAPVVDPEYPEYGGLPPQNPWEMNVSNVNAVDLLRTLKLYDENSEDLMGVLNAWKLHRACEKALANLPPDAGRPDVESRGSGGCRWIECGKTPGYYFERFSQLRDLAKIAIEIGAIISFA